MQGHWNHEAIIIEVPEPLVGFPDFLHGPRKITSEVKAAKVFQGVNQLEGRLKPSQGRSCELKIKVQIVAVRALKIIGKIPIEGFPASIAERGFRSREGTQAVGAD